MAVTRRTLLLTTLLATTSCGDEVIDHGDTLIFSPRELDVADTGVGFTRVEQVFLQNRGLRALDISLTSLLPSSPFTASLGAPRIPPGGQVPVDIEFLPHGADSFSGSFRAEDTSGRFSAKLGVSGEGVSCALVTSASRVDFGSVVVDTLSTESWTVTNACPQRRTFEFLPVTNLRSCDDSRDPSVFCLDRSASGLISLDPGASFNVPVSFQPVVVGVREEARFDVRACAGEVCAETQMALTGFGASDLRCTPNPLDFGEIAVHARQTDEIVCENLGGSRVEVSGWHLRSGSSSAFSVSSAARSLGPGESFAIDVEVFPTQSGRIDGNLEVVMTAPRAERIVLPLQAEGRASLILSPSALDFGEVSLLAPARRSVLLLNVGFAPVAISSIEIDTYGTQSFTSPDANAQVLSPGDASPFRIEFLPRRVGEVISSVRVISNAPGASVLELPVRGEGVQLPPCTFELSLSTLDFGAHRVGDHADLDLTVRNLGTQDCLLTGAGVIAGDTADFELLTSLPRSTSILPGEAAQIRVRFQPLDQGVRGATLELGLSDPLQPWTEVELRGQGR